jgi:uncharacterized protein (TIGR02246 family)
MLPYSPQELSDHFEQAFNAHDLEAVLALYEPTASFVAPPDGRVATGHAALREVLHGFLVSRPQMRVAVKKVVHADNIALMISEWSLTGTDPDGKAIQMGGRASDVLRQQADGTWRVVIDNPMGTT